MTADDQTRPAATRIPSLSQRLRLRVLRMARGGVLRAVPPYARHRARQAAMAATVARLEADFEHIRERHTEQIERLEDLVRELVLSAEALRRATAATRDAPGDEGRSPRAEGSQGRSPRAEGGQGR